jgi:hypothetical protein
MLNLFLRNVPERNNFIIVKSKFLQAINHSKISQKFKQICFQQAKGIIQKKIT